MQQPMRDHAHFGAHRGTVMHAKLLSPRSALAICGLLLFFPMICAAAAPTFKKIADLSTLMPAGLNPDEPFTQLNNILALDTFMPVPGAMESWVTFSGHTAHRYGMYNFHEPRPPLPPLPLEPVAQNILAPPPGATFYSGDNFGHLSSDGGQVAFAPGLAGGGLGNGLVKGAPGSLAFVATNLTPMPGYAANFGGYSEISITNGEVVWRSQSANGSHQTGVYSDLGGIHAIVLPGDAVPGPSGGTFNGMGNFSTVAADGPDIVFSANTSALIGDGIYKYSGGGLSLVMDNNTSRPGAPSEKFSGPHRLAIHQGNIAFSGEFADLSVFPLTRTSGVYSTAGSLHTVADIHMLAPGFGTPFKPFRDNDGGQGGGVSIFGEFVAFVGYAAPPFSSDVAAIYVAYAAGGPVKRLIAAGQTLGGKTIIDLRIRRDSLNAKIGGGYSLAFQVQFADFTSAIYRADFAVPVKKGIAGTGNIAVLRQSSILVEMRDPVGGAPLGTLAFLSDDYVPLSAAALPDSDGNGVAEVAVLAERVSNGRPVVEVQNISGPAAARKIFFAFGNNPIAMSVITGDADNNGTVEIAVLSTRNSDGRGTVEIKNAFGAVNTQTVYTNEGLTPLDLEVVDDADGNGVPEIAILTMRNSDGRTKVEFANAFGALNRAGVYFMPDATAMDLAIVNDADGNSIPEFAVLSTRNSDGRAAVEIRNATGAPNPVTRWLAPGYTPLAVAAMADADGNAVPEVAALSSRNSDGRIAVDVSNAAGISGLNRIFYTPGYSASSLVILDDLDGNTVPEAAVVMIRDSDGRILVQSRNAAGNPALQNYFLSP
jgi:hypothetical protein